MNAFQLTSFVTPTVNLIACNATDDDLDLIAVISSQLGDTLTTIAIQRSIYNK